MWGRLWGGRNRKEEDNVWLWLEEGESVVVAVGTGELEDLKLAFQNIKNNCILPWQGFGRDDFSMHSYFSSMSLRCNIQVH